LVRQLPEEKHSRQELALQLRLGTAYSGFLGFASEPRDKAFRRAMELCAQVEGDFELFPVIWNLSQLNLQRAELAAAHELADQGLNLAERLREPALFSLLTTTWVRYAVWKGHWESPWSILNEHRGSPTLRLILSSWRCIHSISLS